MFANFKKEVNQKALVKTLNVIDTVEKADKLTDLAKEWKEANKISTDFYNQFILDVMKKRLSFF